jgi:cytochrome c-type biogenesis protein CcmH/NrfG
MVAAPRLFAVVAGIAVLVWCEYESVRFGVAGIAVGNANQQLSQPPREGVTLSGSWWGADLERAAREVPGDPSLRELQALVIERSTADAEELMEAQRDLAAALAARPGSGYTWANLAQLKYRLGDTGAAFEKAIVNAVALAPYEPEVQQTVADYGLAVIDEMRPPARAAIERAVASGMKRHAPEILQIAARRGKLGVACRHLDGVPRPAESKWTQLCQSMEATS